MSDLAVSSSNAAAGNSSAPPPTELVDASVNKTGQPLDPSLTLGGEQGFDNAIDNNLQGEAPGAVETEIASRTKPPVITSLTDPLGLASQGVIVDAADNNKSFSDLMATSLAGGSVFLSSFKQKNGAPQIQDPQEAHAGHGSKRGEVGEHIGTGRNEASTRAGHTSKRDKATSIGIAAKRGEQGASNSGTSVSNIYEEIEAAGLISLQNHNQRVKDTISDSDGTSSLEEQSINTNINNFNVQLQQASQGSSHNKYGGVLGQIASAFGANPVISTPSTQGSLTLSLTLPNGETRTTTITTVDYGEEKGLGSVSYTKDTTGAQGQTNDITQTLTETSNTVSGPTRTSISTAQVTNTSSGTLTTASGETIDESGTKTHTGVAVIDNGSRTFVRSSNKEESYSDSADRASMEFDQRDTSITKKKFLHRGDDIKFSSGRKRTRQVVDNNQPAQLVQAVQDVNKLEDLASLLNIQNIMVSMPPQDRNALSLGLQTMTAAAI